MADDRWSAPATDPEPASAAAIAGFAAAVALLALATAAASSAGFWLWFRAFGILQLAVLGPLTAVFVWAGVSRRAVVGIFAAAALCFLLNAAWWGLTLLGASLP